jgi:hypothetical protein
VSLKQTSNSFKFIILNSLNATTQICDSDKDDKLWYICHIWLEMFKEEPTKVKWEEMILEQIFRAFVYSISAQNVPENPIFVYISYSPILIFWETMLWNTIAELRQNWICNKISAEQQTSSNVLKCGQFHPNPTKK